MTSASPERWAKLWREIGAKDDGHAVYHELVSLYSEPHRHYHNLHHIAECLTEFDSARHLARHPLAVELAIWFHDAIYDPRASDNEEKSAELAEKRISQAGGDEYLCASVSALVMATKPPHGRTAHGDAPLISDVDLSILGKPEARFWEYEAQIRREYDWVPKEIFAEKRAEILERFLSEWRIYSTDDFFERYGMQARANIEASLRKLRSPQISAMKFRFAGADDCHLLAELNHQLIRDEGHRNPMNVAQLEERMRSFMETEYRALIFEDDKEVVAYALFREQPQEIYLRQFFVVGHRRREGIARHAIEILRGQIWPKTKRLTVEVLVANKRAVEFWRAMGYTAYALTLEIMPSSQ